MWNVSIRRAQGENVQTKTVFFEKKKNLWTKNVYTILRWKDADKCTQLMYRFMDAAESGQKIPQAQVLNLLSLATWLDIKWTLAMIGWMVSYRMQITDGTVHEHENLRRWKENCLKFICLICVHHQAWFH